MKKLLLLLTLGTIASLDVNAQLRVDSIGHTGFGPDSVELYSSEAGTWGSNLYQVYIVNNKRGLYSESFNQGSTPNWGYAIDGFSDVNSFQYSVGVRATAMNKTGGNTGRGRAFGVFARAGEATDGYNYAIFGNLMNQSLGAAIFGTVVDGSHGCNTGGKYAGYFVGNVKVNGDVTLNGSLLTNAVSGSSDVTTNSEMFHESSDNALSRITSLNPVEYTHNQEALQELLLQKSDTADASPINLKQLNIASLEKTHYGIPVEELEKMFPDLVNESADGRKQVNYIEMIPVLVRAIKELTDKIAVLEDELKNKR